MDLGRHRALRRACARWPAACGSARRCCTSAACGFPVTGPLRYTLTARDAVELCGLIRPRTAIPIHYEGWKHFREGREAIEREFAGAPADFRERVRWLPIGEPVELTAGTDAADPACAASTGSVIRTTSGGGPHPGKPGDRL